MGADRAGNRKQSTRVERGQKVEQVIVHGKWTEVALRGSVGLALWHTYHKGWPPLG